MWRRQLSSSLIVPSFTGISVHIGSGGRKFPRVLKAIAFLGADIPALTDLKEVESLYQKRGGFVECDDEGSEYRVY